MLSCTTLAHAGHSWTEGAAAGALVGPPPGSPLLGQSRCEKGCGYREAEKTRTSPACGAPLVVGVGGSG